MTRSQPASSPFPLTGRHGTGSGICRKVRQRRRTSRCHAQTLVMNVVDVLSAVSFSSAVWPERRMLGPAAESVHRKLAQHVLVQEEQIPHQPSRVSCRPYLPTLGRWWPISWAGRRMAVEAAAEGAAAARLLPADKGAGWAALWSARWQPTTMVQGTRHERHEAASAWHFQGFRLLGGDVRRQCQYRHCCSGCADGICDHADDTSYNMLLCGRSASTYIGTHSVHLRHGLCHMCGLPWCCLFPDVLPQWSSIPIGARLPCRCTRPRQATTWLRRPRLWTRAAN